jgi:hypothetical protein
MKKQSLLNFVLLLGADSVCGQMHLRKGVLDEIKRGIDKRVQQGIVRKLEEPSSWPECINMTVNHCESLISGTVTESVTFQPIDLSAGDVMLSENFVWERVRIFHDDSTPPLVVEPIPRRG